MSVFCCFFYFFFKYLDFFIHIVNRIADSELPFFSLALPIGISFYTFQALSYLADVYSHRVPAEKSLPDFAMYICLFPQLIAGPIVRYQSLRQEIKYRTFSPKQTASGIGRFLVGLSKKLLLADSFGFLIEALEKNGENSFLGLWLIAVSFTLQIYFDFSGYSDMAIGLGLMLGFRFPENFNYPYVSGNITEFWRRWHITLGGFFRDYIYIPMGGSRVSFPRWSFNMLCVWALSGLWHGASMNFVLWGLFYGLLLFLEKLGLKNLLAKLPRFFQHCYTMLFVILGFVIFRQEDLGRLSEILSGMLGFSTLFSGSSFHFAENSPLCSSTALYQLKNFSFLLFTGALGATPLPKLLLQKLFPQKRFLTLAACLYYPALLLLCTAYLISGSFQAFLYFRF